MIWGFGAETEDMNLLRVSADSPVELIETALVANELRYFFEVVLELKFDKRFSEDENWYLNMVIESANFGAYILDVAKSYVGIQDPTDLEVRRGMLAINTLDRNGNSFSRLYNEIVGTFEAGTESLSNDVVMIYAALAGSTHKSEVVAKSQTKYSPDWDFELIKVLEALLEVFQSISFEPSIYSYVEGGKEVNCNGFEVTRPDSSKAAYLNEGGLWAYYDQDAETGELSRISHISLISESTSLHAMTVFVSLEALHLVDIIQSAPKFSRSLKESQADLERAKSFITKVVEGEEFALDSTAYSNAMVVLANFNEFGI
jgi:hypothetical protein